MELEDFYCSEPFGEYRHELRHGQSMALTMNLNRDDKKQPKPFKPIDFMNFVEVPKEKVVVESPEVISARISSELFKL